MSTRQLLQSEVRAVVQSLLDRDTLSLIFAPADALLVGKPDQTYKQEIQGGYLWSPKRNANGARNPFYEWMREVSPWDVVFSFVDTRIAAIGIARSLLGKPEATGVRFSGAELGKHLRPVLPNRYSPLQLNGNGIQSVYLTEVPRMFAEVLTGLIGEEAVFIKQGQAVSETEHGGVQPLGDDLDAWEHRLETQVEADSRVPETEKEALVRARCGQGLFKERVMAIESRCRITGVDKPVHLVASHCKPWRDSSNEERLNGENGLLLTPSIDHLFDRGFIGFEDSGTLIISPVAHRPSLARMGIETEHLVNVGGFSEGQRKFLDFHQQTFCFERRDRHSPRGVHRI